MNTAPFVQYRLLIEPLTPIHVGSGQTIEPHEYHLVQEGDQYWLVIFDLGKALADAEPRRRSELDLLAGRRDMIGLRRWIRQNVDLGRHTLWRVRLEKTTYAEIRQNLNNPERLGQIHLFTRHAATGRPYLPGSSLKGALRTALVDMLARKDAVVTNALAHRAQQLAQRRGGGPSFEAAVLGHAGQGGKPDLYHDPFRQLAISDIHLPEEAFLIDRVQIITARGRPTTGAEEIPIYRDLFAPHLQASRTVVRGQLRLAHVVARTAPLPQRFDVATICRACNQFYRPRLQEELQRFVSDAQLNDQLLEQTGSMDDNQCLLRLGRHSHFECVTVGEPFHRPPRGGFGKSRSYVRCRVPLGWMRLTIHKAGPP